MAIQYEGRHGLIAKDQEDFTRATLREAKGREDYSKLKEMAEHAAASRAEMLKKFEAVVELARAEYDGQPIATMEPYLDKFRQYRLKLATMEREMAEAALVDRKAAEKGSGAALQKPIARKKLEAELAKSFTDFMAE